MCRLLDSRSRLSANVLGLCRLLVSRSRLSATVRGLCRLLRASCTASCRGHGGASSGTVRGPVSIVPWTSPASVVVAITASAVITHPRAATLWIISVWSRLIATVRTLCRLLVSSCSASCCGHGRASSRAVWGTVSIVPGTSPARAVVAVTASAVVTDTRAVSLRSFAGTPRPLARAHRYILPFSHRAIKARYRRLQPR